MTLGAVVPLALALALLLVACGAAPAERIVAGEAVGSASLFPYQCAVYDFRTGVFLCGCSLISKAWVLTAASCLRTLEATSDVDRDANNLQVLLGSVQLTRPTRIAAVSRALIHPSWTFATSQPLRVNLAWMNLAIDVPFSSVTLPVQLATAEEAAVFAAPGAGAGVVAGWGSTGAVFPASLQSAASNVVAAATCNAVGNTSR